MDEGVIMLSYCQDQIKPYESLSLTIITTIDVDQGLKHNLFLQKQEEECMVENKFVLYLQC